jgi:RimJ/RimL family protein N-acetyltransferase
MSLAGLCFFFKPTGAEIPDSVIAMAWHRGLPSAHSEMRAGARKMRLARVKRVMRSALATGVCQRCSEWKRAMIPVVTEASLSLRAFTRADLRIVEPWFRDPDTRRFLGGPEWPRKMLELGQGVVGQEFRGAIQTGAYRYLAHVDGGPMGYVDCGTFNRCAVYAGEGAGGPIVTEPIEDATGSLAFVIDPQVRRRGVGSAMISALIDPPELGFVELLEAGVEPGNVASRRCLSSGRV